MRRGRRHGHERGYAKAARIEAPQAKVVFDKFDFAALRPAGSLRLSVSLRSAHVVKCPGEAVDRTRRAEHHKLMEQGDETLKVVRHLFLYNPQNLSAEQSASFEQLLKANLKSGQAWAFKELFSELWEQPDVKHAARLLDQWRRKVKRSRLEHMKRAADTIEAHREGILNYFIHRITNALAEGFNSRIQQIKAAARGFRNFANYHARILFFLSGLDLAPSPSH